MAPYAHHTGKTSSAPVIHTSMPHQPISPAHQSTNCRAQYPSFNNIFNPQRKQQNHTNNTNVIVHRASDDSISALHVIHPANHILLLVPTRPQSHQFLYQPLVEQLTLCYNKSVKAMDYTPPPSHNNYLCFDARHRDALRDESCAGVIVVVRDEGVKTRGASMDFAKAVWEEGVRFGDVPGVLVEIGGVRRDIGEWDSILWAGQMGDDVWERVAQVIFG